MRAQEVTALADALAGSLRALLVTPRALFRRLPEAAALAPIVFRRGEEVDLEGLARQLTAQGYRRVDLVGEVGDFAVRGGVFDVFAAGDDEPLRLDLFGSEIESLRRFEVDSQRSHDELREAAVLPLALFPEGPEAARRLAKVLLEVAGDEPGREARDHIASLADGGHFAGWENLLPLLAPRSLTLAELLPDALWVALDPATLVAEARHHGQRLAEEFAARREHSRFALEPELLEHPVATVVELIETAPAIVEPLASTGDTVDFGVFATDLFHGQLPRFPQEVATAALARRALLLVVSPSSPRAHRGAARGARGAARARAASSWSPASSSAASGCRPPASPSTASSSSCRRPAASSGSAAAAAASGRSSPACAT